ncbi:FxSxx-COOH system tetratricopeptide repeat protein [Actinacidiphila yeochonensis]|uniref:FxSxx-COOH system tetratricopeptide repeat protein n=1 Tax=Actinacidiphila yeochonensis TaxID=89050 RepID=UPI00056994BA|nr:FxSxx-COOH system tetratricopeptide repeat protein [Actinacidiphila yeochonensis]
MTQQAGGAPRGVRVVVFYAGSGAVGQTTTVAHTAVAMAGAGRRTLVVHVPGSGPDSRLVDHLRHHAGGVRVARAEDAPSAGPLPAPWEWRLPGDGGTVPLWVLDLPDAAALARLPVREAAARAAVYHGYDTVLVDAPVPRTSEQAMVLGRLGHVLAACFGPTSWSVDAAAALAREMGKDAESARGPRPAGGAGAARPFDLVVVGIRTDNRLSEQLRLARDRVRTAFRGLAGDRAVPYVEIPFDQVETLEAAAGREDVRPPVPTTPAERRPPRSAVRRGGYARLADVLDRPVSYGVERVTVVGPERSRAWLEWLEEQVHGANLACATVPLAEFTGTAPASGEMLLVVPPVGAPRERIAALERLSHPDVRVVVVDDEPLPAGLGHHERLDLRRCEPADAAARLRHALRLPPPAAAVGGAAAFPVLPERHNLPPRDPAFTGRDGLLLAIRERFAEAAAGPVPGLLTGVSGIGKSALALEFCHRFAGAHRIVWWLDAADRTAVERGLGLLAESVGLPERDEPQEVLAWLGSPDAPSWLLVYDDADDPEALAGLLPRHGNGNVLLTCREEDGLPGGRAFAVPPLSLDESRDLIGAAVPDLDPALADQIGQAMGRGPLAVALAGAWVRLRAERRMAEDNRPRPAALREAADRLMTAFGAHQQQLLARGDAVPLERVMLEAAVADLPAAAGGTLWDREPSGTRALERLLECCALLAPVGMDTGLLNSPALMAALAGPGPGPGGGRAAAVRDPLVVHAALWALVQQGLLELRTDPAGAAGGPHPGQTVRQVRPLREMVLARMDPAERALRERQVRGILAEGAGRDAGGPGDGAPASLDARALRLTALSLWTDERPEVRRVVLADLAALIATREHRRLTEALRIARTTARQWYASPPPLEYLRLRNHTAQAYRTLGRYPRAAEAAEEALRGHRMVLGLDHPRSLLSADSFGAILRSQGAMLEARVLGRHVRGTLAGILGPDHPATTQTEHNLALAEALCGDYRAAFDLLQHRRDVLAATGRTDPSSMGILAFVHRGLGQNRESFDLLKLYLHQARGAAGAESASAEIGLAVSERRLGLAARGRQAGLVESALERDQRILDACRKHFGDGQLITERCRFSLATDLHATHKHGEALDTIRTCRKALEDTLGEDHPYTGLAAVREGVHLRAVDEADAALDTGTRALEALRDGLGHSHPWVAAAAAAVAGTLVARGHHDNARQYYREALETLDDLGQERHPDRALVARDLRVLDAPGGPGDGTGQHRDIDLELPDL